LHSERPTDATSLPSLLCAPLASVTIHSARNEAEWLGAWNLQSGKTRFKSCVPFPSLKPWLRVFLYKKQAEVILLHRTAASTEEMMQAALGSTAVRQQEPLF
jgi:hypothetical protein